MYHMLYESHKPFIGIVYFMLIQNIPNPQLDGKQIFGLFFIFKTNIFHQATGVFLLVANMAHTIDKILHNVYKLFVKKKKTL